MKKIFAIFLLLCAPLAFAVPVAPITNPHVTFVNSTGGPCAGCSLYTYIAGTTSPLATYTDSTGIPQNTNPIILDASGGAFIWLGTASYKFILKDTGGTTLWTVDNVNGSSLLPCGPAGAIQIANSALNGLNCDSNITINTVTHSINVGTLPTNHVTIGALGTPTAWTFDTTTPATALASLGTVGNVSDTPGTTTPNLIALSTAGLHTITYSPSIPSAITATTQTASDNSGKVATTAYVAAPGAIGPSSLSLASGTPMTLNQGNGALLQHSTGTTTSGHFVIFDANGNTVDGGFGFTHGNNSNGYWVQDPTGTITERGSITVTNGGGTLASGFIVFPLTFPTALDSLIVSGSGYANGSSQDSETFYSAGATTSGATAIMRCAVNIGGSGCASISNTVTIYWVAIGR